MKSKLLSLIGLMTLVSIALVGCRTASAQEASSPEKVVRGYYSWYLDNLSHGAEKNDFRNPLQDSSYQKQGALSQEFIERIEEMKANGLSADPLLCAQDFPQSFSISSVDLSPMGEEARVTVETSFEQHEFQVYLQKLAGDWKIAGVICITNN